MNTLYLSTLDFLKGTLEGAFANGFVAGIPEGQCPVVVDEVNCAVLMYI